MDTVNIKVTINGELVEYEVSAAAWDLFLSAAEIGIEGADDGANTANVDDADDLLEAMRHQFGEPTSTPAEETAAEVYDRTGDERLRTVM